MKPYSTGQIKTALGISGVDTAEYAWRSETSDPGSQIDLLIDRKDGVINLCEMKYTDGIFELNKTEYEKLQNRLCAFQKETKPRKAIHMTLVSVNGLADGKYAFVFQNVITGEQLFAKIEKDLRSGSSGDLLWSPFLVYFTNPPHQCSEIHFGLIVLQLCRNRQ